jgi:F1F0 ATPase subunit 2
MTDGLGWLVAAAGGALIAALYFAGLWYTVQRVPHARYPFAVLVASFVLRAGLAAGALWVVVQGDVLRLLVALGAFLVVRAAVVWRVRPALHGGRTAARGH